MYRESKSKKELTIVVTVTTWQLVLMLKSLLPYVGSTPCYTAQFIVIVIKKLCKFKKRKFPENMKNSL